MPSDEVTHTFEIESEQRDWLGEIAEEYGFADEDKALRVLLDYAIQDWGQRPDLRGSQHALPLLRLRKEAACTAQAVAPRTMTAQGFARAAAMPWPSQGRAQGGSSLSTLGLPNPLLTYPTTSYRPSS